MLNALLALLEEKGVASKDEVMMKAYGLLQDSGGLSQVKSQRNPSDMQAHLDQRRKERCR
jgi:hypothetical protein